MEAHDEDRLPGEPSQAEIAAATALIRSKWTAAEWRKRGAWMMAGPVEVVEVEFDHELPAEW